MVINIAISNEIKIEGIDTKLMMRGITGLMSVGMNERPVGGRREKERRETGHKSKGIRRGRDVDKNWVMA